MNEKLFGHICNAYTKISQIGEEIDTLITAVKSEDDESERALILLLKNKELISDTLATMRVYFRIKLEDKQEATCQRERR